MASPAKDHRITHEFPEAAIARWDANLRAMRLARELESEGRQATPEEQRVLADFNTATIAAQRAGRLKVDADGKLRRADAAPPPPADDYLAGMKDTQLSNVIDARHDTMDEMDTIGAPEESKQAMQSSIDRYQAEADRRGLPKRERRPRPQAEAQEPALGDAPAPADDEPTGGAWMVGATDMPMGADDAPETPAPKPKRERKARPPKPEPTDAPAEAQAPAPEPVDQDDDGPLYRGHRGPGIGKLAEDLPERRDGDQDTVVVERGPRKSDEYSISPKRVPDATKKRVLDDLNREQVRVMTAVKLTADERKRVKELFDAERAAVRYGTDRNAVFEERSRIVGEAKKRGRKTPSEAATQVARAVNREREDRLRGSERKRRDKGVKDTAFTMPTVTVRTR